MCFSDIKAEYDLPDRYFSTCGLCLGGPDCALNSSALRVYSLQNKTDSLHDCPDDHSDNAEINGDPASI